MTAGWSTGTQDSARHDPSPGPGRATLELRVRLSVAKKPSSYDGTTSSTKKSEGKVEKNELVTRDFETLSEHLVHS